MKPSVLFALSAPLLALAKPMAHERLHKRGGEEVTTTTVYEEATVTVDVTTTICVPQAPNQAQANLGDHKPVAQPNSNEAHPTPEAQPPKPQADEAAKPVPPPAQPPSAPVEHKAQVHPPVDQAPKHEDTKPKPQPQVQQPQPVNKQPKPDVPKAGPNKDQPGNGHHSGGPTGGSCGQVGGKCMASDVTIYNDQGTGACGWKNDTNTDDFFALSKDQWDGFTNDMPDQHKNKWCGRMAMISVNGKTFEGMLTDKCPGCSGWSIDLSQSLWTKAFNEAPTRKFNIEWWFTGPEIYHGKAG